MKSVRSSDSVPRIMVFRGYFFRGCDCSEDHIVPRVLLDVPRELVRGYLYLFCRWQLEKSVRSSDVVPRIMLFPKVLGSIFVKFAEALVVCSSFSLEGIQCSFLGFISG